MPNPAGRPKGGRPKGWRPIIDVIGARRRVAILQKLADQAERGDTASAKLLLERMDPVLSRQELTGAEGKPVQLEHAEKLVEQIPTDVLREIDALAARVNIERGNGATKPGNGAAQ